VADPPGARGGGKRRFAFEREGARGAHLLGRGMGEDRVEIRADEDFPGAGAFARLRVGAAHGVVAHPEAREHQPAEAALRRAEGGAAGDLVKPGRGEARMIALQPGEDRGIAEARIMDSAELFGEAEAGRDLRIGGRRMGADGDLRRIRVRVELVIGHDPLPVEEKERFAGAAGVHGGGGFEDAAGAGDVAREVAVVQVELGEARSGAVHAAGGGRFVEGDGAGDVLGHAAAFEDEAGEEIGRGRVAAGGGALEMGNAAGIVWKEELAGGEERAGGIERRRVVFRGDGALEQGDGGGDGGGGARRLERGEGDLDARAGFAPRDALGAGAVGGERVEGQAVAIAVEDATAKLIAMRWSSRGSIVPPPGSGSPPLPVTVRPSLAPPPARRSPAGPPPSRRAGPIP
jgi:hypothetical protein